GDSAALESAYRKIATENVSLREKVVQLGKDSHRAHHDAKDAAGEQGNAIEAVGTKIAGMVAAYATVGTAVRAVAGEVKALIELQKESAAAQAELANPRASLLQNLGADLKPEERAQVNATIERASQMGLGKLGDLTRAYGDLASATPDLTQEERQKTFMVAARFAPDAASLPSIASGLGDTANLTGSKDAEENLGVIAATAQKSRSTTTKAVAENIMPAAANIKKNFGDDSAEAIALAVAIQNATSDPEGAKSGTGAQQTAEQIHEFFLPKNIDSRTIAKLKREKSLGPWERSDPGITAALSDFFATDPAAQGAGGMARSTKDQVELLERNQALQDAFLARQRDQTLGKVNGQGGVSDTRSGIERLQSAPAMAEEFLKDYHGEQAPKEAVMTLIRDKNSKIAKFYEEMATEGIPQGAEAARQGRAAIENVRSDPMVKARQEELQAENTKQLMLIANEKGAAKARAREARADLLRTSGVTGFRNYLEGAEFDVDTGLRDVDAAKALRERITFRHDVLMDPGHIDSFGGRDLSLPGRRSTDEERRHAAILEGEQANLDQQIWEKAHPGMPHVDFYNLRKSMPTDTRFYGLQQAAGHQGARIDQALIDRAQSSPEELIGHSKEIRQLVVEVAAAEEAAYKRADRTHSEQDRADARELTHDRQTFQEMLTALKAIEQELNIGRREAAAQGRQQDARFQASKRHGRE
ncbi:MAG TPA: hypothetical protein VFH56_17100, partial [Acidimicrobiales bacterium]|nr:hypothetical protein [Acidimicrobiales bacterium]